MSDNINNFISELKKIFPEIIEYEGKETDTGTKKVLTRHILYIDDGIPITITNSDETNIEILRQFLNILDINLGNIYKRVSSRIYNNRKSWKVNKWEEMLSSGLIYVSYWGGTDTENNSKRHCGRPMVFLSFMLTEEIDVSRLGITDFVVYLYEIQILPEIRGLGIGQRLLKCLRDTSIGYNDFLISNNNNNNLNININSACQNGTIITAIVLTVFSQNEAAIKFYNKLQFQFTVGSPRDEFVTDRIANRTRKRRQNAENTTTTTTTTASQDVIKPIYYLLYLPL